MSNIVLVGFMGTGKTTTGRILAQKLGWEFVDIDRAIEAECGMCVGDIFSTHGEAFFRAKEHAMIERVTSRSGMIIATGGGAVLSDVNVKKLQQCGTVVTLEAKPDVVLNRIEQDPTPRPLLKRPDKQYAIRQLMQERAARYKIADLYIDTSSVTPGAVADRIISHVRMQQCANA